MSSKGYKGDLSAAAALNTMTTDGSAVLVDIRRTSEKESSGVPDLPSGASGRAIELEYAFTEVMLPTDTTKKFLCSLSYQCHSPGFR